MSGFFVRNPSYANSTTGSLVPVIIGSLGRDSLPKYKSGFVFSPSASSSVSLTTVTSITTSDTIPSISPWPISTSRNLPNTFWELVYSLIKGEKKSYDIQNQSGPLQSDADHASIGPVLVTYTVESTQEIEHNSTQTTRTGIPRSSSRVSSLFVRMKSSLRKLWRVLTQSMKRNRRHTEPEPPRETTSIKSANDITWLEDEIEQTYPGVTSSTPIVSHHPPPVLYPTELNLSIPSVNSWDSFGSIETTGSDEISDVSLFGSFSSRSVTLSFFSEADESTSDSDFSPRQLSFNSL